MRRGVWDGGRGLARRSLHPVVIDDGYESLCDQRDSIPGGLRGGAGAAAIEDGACSRYRFALENRLE